MFSQIRFAALAAIATVGFALTVAPADAWQCHGSYQSYGSDYSQPYQNYSQGYDQNYSQGYYPRYSYQHQYQNNQGYSYGDPEQDYSQGYSCQGQACDPRYPSDQYSYGQDYNNGPSYQDDGPNDGS